MLEGRAVRLTLGSPGRATFVVAGPDGQPVLGARVVPRSVAREVLELPEVLGELAASTTDREGRRSSRRFGPRSCWESVSWRADSGPSRGSSVWPMAWPTSGEGDHALANGPGLGAGRGRGPVGGRRLDGPRRLVERRPRDGRLGLRRGVDRRSGPVRYPQNRGGDVNREGPPAKGSPDLPARVVRRSLEAGRSVQVEIPLRRGVRVTGFALDDRDGRPIPGVVVSLMPSGPAAPFRVRTDGEGRYEAFVPSGLVRPTGS